jgi:hypothetical protein
VRVSAFAIGGADDGDGSRCQQPAQIGHDDSIT